MEGADGDGVSHVVGGGPADGEGDDVNAVSDGGVEGDEDVGVEALVIVDRGPAYLVAGDAGPGGSALGRSGAGAGAEEAGSRYHVAGGGGEGVGAVALHVAWAVRGGILFPGVRLVALDKVPSSDQLPVVSLH